MPQRGSSENSPGWAWTIGSLAGQWVPFWTRTETPLGRVTDWVPIAYRTLIIGMAFLPRRSPRRRVPGASSVRGRGVMLFGGEAEVGELLVDLVDLLLRFAALPLGLFVVDQAGVEPVDLPLGE